MGALGRIHANGDLDLALTIRTFAVVDDQIHLWVGGGIVWDSEADAEIEESWVKARPLLALLADASSSHVRCQVPAVSGRVTP
jgi:anthranilate/para-aminobenzoate synthase component I